MTAKDEGRAKLMAQARGHLASTGRPRLVMLGMMVASIGAAWLASAGLLRLGVDPMWARYPLAVLAGYGALLGLLAAWVWARVAAESHHADDPEGLFATGLAALALGSLAKKWPARPLDASEPKDEARRWWHSIDFPSGDLGGVDHPGAILVLAVLGGLAILCVGTVMVVTSPELLAQLWVDGVAPRLDPPPGLKQAPRWFGTAVRSTGGLAVFLALALSFVGWELGHHAPGARTLGEAWSMEHARSR